MYFMHGFIKFAGILSKPDEDLPFKCSVTLPTSFSITKKMNMLLDIAIYLLF